MRALPKAKDTKAAHPPRPRGGERDIRALHKMASQQFPKALAELAK